MVGATLSRLFGSASGDVSLQRGLMKRILLTGVLAIAVCTAVAAQDYIFTNFAANRDLPVPPAPCVLQGNAAPVVYDTSLWIFYTCADNRVIARRFFHPNDQAEYTTPRPVIIVRDMTTQGTPATVPPPTCPAGFVVVHGDMCVPPDHPLATGR